MAHRYKKTARALQTLWDSSYTDALRACIDTASAGDFVARIQQEKTDKDVPFNVAFLSLCVEDWEFVDEHKETA